VRRLTRDLGYSFDASGPAIAHPATVAVLTPQGVVSRYFSGVQFEPAEMRVALADARADRVGQVTSRLALLCAHFDPQVGRWSGAVMDAVRAGCIALVVLLGAWCWKRRRGGAA